MSLRTLIELSGSCSVVAESAGPVAGDAPTITVYLGDTVILRLPPDVADALADALADVEPIIMWPAR